MQHHLMRLDFGRRVYFLLALLAVSVLASCASQRPLPLSNPGVPGPDPDYVVTVDLASADTVGATELRYGGRVVLWEPGSYAVVAVEPQADLTTLAAFDPDIATVEPNKDMFLNGGQMAEMSGTSSLWAGGTSSLWAGGTSSLWAGGTSSLWAGGTFAWLPENTGTWRQIGLEQAQALAKNLGYGVTVAVIDTGVDVTHPALKDALAPRAQWWDFVDNDPLPQEVGSFGAGGYGHGTNVAGIIRQIAPRASILPLRVLGPDGQGDVVDLTAAIQYAVRQGAQIINLSLGSDQKIKAVEKAIKEANKQGVYVVASTGNTGDKHVTFPASDANGKAGKLQVSVTSVDAEDNKSGFATYDKKIELAAPGENVFGPAPDLQRAAWSGTSMAAPMAAGALALALAEDPKDREDLAEELMKRSDDLYNGHRNETYKNQIGEGRLDTEAFLKSVLD